MLLRNVSVHQDVDHHMRRCRLELDHPVAADQTIWGAALVAITDESNWGDVSIMHEGVPASNLRLLLDPTFHFVVAVALHRDAGDELAGKLAHVAIAGFPLSLRHDGAEHRRRRNPHPREVPFR